MRNDPIIAELHRIRAAHAERCGYDLQAMFEDVKRQEEQSGRTCCALPIKRRVIKPDTQAQQASKSLPKTINP